MYFIYQIIGYHQFKLEIQNLLVILAVMVVQFSIFSIRDISINERQFTPLLVFNFKLEYRLFLRDLQGHLSVRIIIIIAVPFDASQLKQESKTNASEL